MQALKFDGRFFITSLLFKVKDQGLKIIHSYENESSQKMQSQGMFCFKQWDMSGKR